MPADPVPENSVTGHADHRAIQREAHFAHVLSAIVRAYDHPADGTAYVRMREAIDDARRLLHEPFPNYVSDARPRRTV